MALDRQFIEKRDFPIGRRGYEQASVDSHLARVAREVDELQRAARSVPDAPAAATAPTGAASLAALASTQVQAIVEAAETTAASIEQEARAHAATVETDAAREGQRIRDEAVAQSQDNVAKVHEAASLMLQRVDAMESELAALVDSLRTGANRLGADLSLLSDNMGELYSAVGPAPEAPPEVILEEEIEIVTVIEEADEEPAVDELAPAAVGDDVEGARLIALNMALNGQTRKETDKYLAENFDLSDRAGLLDEVYATVEG
ncbi:MAG: DivIVA domain-containing protein [Solirubrobacteraceae bacterium]